MLYKGVRNKGVRAITYRSKKKTKKVADSGPQISILSPSYAKLQIQIVIDVLNSSTTRVPNLLNESRGEWQTVDRTEMQQELRRLIAEWDRSGPNLLQLFKRNPHLQESCIHGTTLLMPTRDGVAQLAWTPQRTDNKSSTQKDVALTHFIRFLVNPLALKLGGPCARCDRFYIKNTPRQKKYCSPQCGMSTTALSATRKRREAEYAMKLLKAQQLVEQYGNRRTPKGWKEWICAKTMGGITEKWLTRAEGLKRLMPPAV
jgi:hypothetical protein